MSHAKQNSLIDGATCVLGLILNGKLTIANVGDSVATLVKKDGSISQLSTDHLASSAREQARIQQAEGTIMYNRVNGSINVSRAFGNKDHKPLIIAEPEG